MRFFYSQLQVILSAVILLGFQSATGRGEDPSNPFRPIGLAVSPEMIHVASRDQGRIVTLNSNSGKMISEFRLKGRIHAFIRSSITGQFGLSATEESKFYLLTPNEKGLSVHHRIDLSCRPYELAFTNDGLTLAISHRWAHRVSFFSRTDHQSHFKQRNHIDLPFPTGLLTFYSEGKKCIVADAFGGHLAVIDCEKASILNIKKIEGHNIRSLSVSKKEPTILLSHQTLNEKIPTTRERVFWGTLMGNILRTIKIDHLEEGTLDPEKLQSRRFEEVHHWSLVPLGDPGKAAGDPGQMVQASSGELFIALTGVGELGWLKNRVAPMERFPTGLGSSALHWESETRTLYTTNTFDDSISILKFGIKKSNRKIHLPQPKKVNASDRGEAIFNDARLSLDSWYSCASCHPDGYSVGLLNDNLDDGSFDTPKKIQRLGGLSETAPYSWLGKEKKLEDQIVRSISSTLRNPKPPTKTVINDLSAYLKSLQAPPSLLEARGLLKNPQIKKGVAEGKRIFQKHSCDRCHREPHYTNPELELTNSRDESGQRKFNPPALTGVSHAMGFLHDNRAKTLRELFQTHRHPHGDAIPDDELDKLILFLKSL